MKHLLFGALIILFIAGCHNKAGEPAIQTGKAISLDTSAGSCPYLTRDNRGNIAISWIREDASKATAFCYGISKDEGKSFEEFIEIPGSNNVKPHGENLPKVIFKPSGEIIAAWGAANPNPVNKYSGLVYYSQSNDGGKTWTTARSLTTDTSSFDQRYFDMALLPDGEVAIVWLDNRKKLG